MFKRIDHVEIVTDQPERTERFYVEVLGFRRRSELRIPLSSPGAEMRLVYLDLGDGTVELMSYEGVEVAPQPRKEHLGYRMMALEVEDMQKAVAHLESKGVAVTWGPVVREGLYARAEIQDPNGFAIELRQWFDKGA
jgi:glyoxylase I family protein